VETDYSVPVSQGYDRNVPGYVVLHLDNLLIGNGDVGAVGEGEIIRHLLLDRDLGSSNHGGVARQSLRVDLHPAHPKQTLQAAVEGAVKGLIDEQVGGFSAKAKGSGGIHGSRFFLGASGGGG